MSLKNGEPAEVKVQPTPSSLGKFSTAAAVAVAMGGCIALSSWWSHVPSIQNFLALKPDVALGFILAGASLRLFNWKGLNSAPGKVFAFLVAAMGFLVWVEHVTHWHVSPKEILRFIPADRMPESEHMPLSTALGFFLIGCALLLLDRRTPDGNRPAHTLVLIASTISAIALVGFLYHVQPLYHPGDYQYLALYIPLLFLLISAGILCARPDGTFMQIVVGEGVGSHVLRRLLPPVVALLVFLSWLRLAGQRAGFFENDVGTAIMVIVHILIFAGLVFVIAFSLNRSDGHRQLLERRIHERTLMLEAANRELETFAYSVAHDLRAPLRAIDGLSLATLQDYSDKLDQDARDSLERVRENAQRMNQLINGLLELSRMSRAQMHPKPIDLTQMARQIVAELRERDPSREVEISISDGLTARGDASLLGSVVENLLNNAWKFSARRPTAKIEFGKKMERTQPVFFVRDNGIGFDMNYADKLFGPFQRLHSREDFAGHGIGLATVQRVIHRHGGRIWAESKLEQGATFYFTLQS